MVKICFRPLDGGAARVLVPQTLKAVLFLSAHREVRDVRTQAAPHGPGSCRMAASQSTTLVFGARGVSLSRRHDMADVALLMAVLVAAPLETQVHATTHASTHAPLTHLRTLLCRAVLAL